MLVSKSDFYQLLILYVGKDISLMLMVVPHQFMIM